MDYTISDNGSGFYLFSIMSEELFQKVVMKVKACIVVSETNSVTTPQAKLVQVVVRTT